MPFLLVVAALTTAVLTATLTVPAKAAGLPQELAARPSATPLVTKTITLTAPSALNTTWKRIQKIGFGAAASKLGTSPAGEGLILGPSYGVQVPNRTWWYADAAKLRLAHYGDTGAYLGQVKLPGKYLHLGYFQWQNPVALKDGSVVLTSTTIDSPALLRLSASGKLSRTALSRFVNVHSTDGIYLYGFDDAGKKVRVAPVSGKITAVTWFRGQGGRKFQLSVNDGYLRVLRPEVNLRLDLKASGLADKTVHPSVQAVMSANGRLWVLIVGFVELTPDTNQTVAGLISVSASGAVSAVQPARDPTSPADPGDGHNLGIRYGGTHPTMMFIDPGAVRVHRKR